MPCARARVLGTSHSRSGMTLRWHSITSVASSADVALYFWYRISGHRVREAHASWASATTIAVTIGDKLELNLPNVGLLELKTWRLANLR